MSVRTDRIDEAILSRIGADHVAIRDLTHGSNYRTVRAAVERLHKAGRLDRTWDGNERFGRYLYFRVESKAKGA
jgi:DNA-binding transcriptional regulator PaaX